MKNVTEYSIELLNNYSTKSIKVYIVFSALAFTISSTLFIVSMAQGQTSLLYASFALISFLSMFLTYFMQRTVQKTAVKLSTAKVTYTFFDEHFHLHFQNKKASEKPIEVDIHYEDVLKMVSDDLVVKIYLRGVSSFFLMSKAGFKTHSKEESIVFLKSKIRVFKEKRV